MRRKTYLRITGIVAVLVAVFTVDYFINLGIMSSTNRSLFQERAIRLIDEANYCTSAAECVKIPRGHDKKGACLIDEVLVNIKEADKIPALCRQAAGRVMVSLGEPVSDPGMDTPRCVKGSCFSSARPPGTDCWFGWEPGTQRETVTSSGPTRRCWAATRGN